MHLKETGPRQVFWLLKVTFKPCPAETRILIQAVLKSKISQGRQIPKETLQGNSKSNQISSDKKSNQPKLQKTPTTKNFRKNKLCTMTIFLHFEHFLLKTHLGEHLLLSKNYLFQKQKVCSLTATHHPREVKKKLNTPIQISSPQQSPNLETILQKKVRLKSE